MNEHTKAKVYYNSACPVCRAGVASQQERMASCGIQDTEWVDVHAHPEAVQEVGASLEQVRERLYVKTADGTVAVGADAFAVLLAKTPGQRWLGRLLRLPGLRWLATRLYNVFAAALYHWNRRKGHW